MKVMAKNLRLKDEALSQNAPTLVWVLKLYVCTHTQKNTPTIRIQDNFTNLTLILCAVCSIGWIRSHDSLWRYIRVNMDNNTKVDTICCAKLMMKSAWAVMELVSYKGRVSDRH